MTSASSSALAGSSPSRSLSLLGSAPSPTLSASSTTSCEPVDAIDPAGAELARKLHALENLIDEAYAASGELAAAVVRARLAHKLSPVVGHSIVSSFDGASSAMVAAKGHLVKGHRLLEQLGQRIGAPTNYGDTTKDGDDKVFGGA